MTIGTSGNLLRETKTIIFTMVAFHVRFNRNIGDLVPGHHLLVAVALHTDFCMELAPLMIFGPGQLVDRVQIMTVMAGRGIHIARCNRFSMDGVTINRFLVVALDTFSNRYALVIFPVRVGMHVRVTLGARNTLFSMNTGIMLGCLLLVTALTMYFFYLDLFAHMLGEVGNINMTAGTGIFAMNRRGKIVNGKLITVAA